MSLCLTASSNAKMSEDWYAATSDVIAATTGSVLYGRASWLSNGSTELSIIMLANTKYLRQ